MFSNAFSLLQKIGRAFMLPIALLPAAGLLLGIGGALSNTATVAAYPFLDISVLQIIFKIMAAAGSVIFANLPLLFAIGIAVGMADADNGAAGVAATIGFLVMHQTINIILSITGHLAVGNISAAGQANVLGIQTLEMGVFGGIICGIVTVFVHNKFRKTELPQFLAFFNGVRLVPILAAVTFLIVGALMIIVWPPVQSVIRMLGSLVNGSGYVGTFFYGLIERSLIPFGLHHIFYLPFWQTDIGGVKEIGGHVVAGAQNIFFAELADPNTTHFSIGVARFMAGKMPFMMFGLPAAAFAMYHAAFPENKKKVQGLLFSAGLTAFLTGITEPLEFTFLFVAPFLYVIHAILAGVSFMLMHMLQVTVGQTFSGGFIDFMLFGVLQGVAKTNWIYIPIVGVFYAIIYYTVFYLLITKLNLRTPGRETLDEETNIKVNTGGNQKEFTLAVIEALGGVDNLASVDACITRLRLKLKDVGLMQEAKLKALGAAGVMKIGNGVQVIFGPISDNIKQNILEIIKK